MFRDRPAAIATPCRALAVGIMLAFSAVLPAAAQGQQQPAAPSGEAAAQPPAPKVNPQWFRLCGKEPENNVEVCAIQSFAVAEAGNVVADVQVMEVKGDNPTKRFRVSMQPGFLIPPGMNLVIDDDTKSMVEGRYLICFPNACLLEAQLTDEFINRMKRGSTLAIYVAADNRQWVPAKVSLSGFTKAFDGPPTSQSDYEAWLKTFMESQASVEQEIQSYLLRRGEGQRNQLQQNQGQQGQQAPAAPAGSAAPAQPN